MTNRRAASTQVLELRQLSRRDGTLSDEILSEIGRLRIAAWLADGELPSLATCAESWTDEHDDHAEHFVIYAEGRICAACRVCIHDHRDSLPDAVTVDAYRSMMSFPAAFINRLVVAPPWRGRHLTAELDRARIRFAADSQARSIVGATHNKRRLRHLDGLGFLNIGVSSHATVSYSPTFVLVRTLPVQVATAKAPLTLPLAGKPSIFDRPISPDKVPAGIRAFADGAAT